MTPNRHGHVTYGDLGDQVTGGDNTQERAVSELLADLADRDPDLHGYLSARLNRDEPGRATQTAAAGQDAEEPLMIGDSAAMRPEDRVLGVAATDDRRTADGRQRVSQFTGEAGPFGRL